MAAGLFCCFFPGGSRVRGKTVHVPLEGAAFATFPLSIRTGSSTPPTSRCSSIVQSSGNTFLHWPLVFFALTHNNLTQNLHHQLTLFGQDVSGPQGMISRVKNHVELQHFSLYFLSTILSYPSSEEVTVPYLVSSLTATL